MILVEVVAVGLLNSVETCWTWVLSHLQNHLHFSPSAIHAIQSSIMPAPRPPPMTWWPPFARRSALSYSWMTLRWL